MIRSCEKDSAHYDEDEAQEKRWDNAVIVVVEEGIADYRFTADVGGEPCN